MPDLRPYSLVERTLGFGSALGIVLGMSSVARADFFIHHWEDHHAEESTLNLGGELNYYSTSNNYDQNGNSFQPSTLNSYTKLEFDAIASYGFTDKFSAYARLTWARANLDGTERPGDGYGLADQSLGLNYRVYENHGPSVDLQLQGDFPGYSNATADTNMTPFLGDGSVDITPGAMAVYPFFRQSGDHIDLVGGLGITFRNAGYSSAIPWSLAGKYVPRHDGLFGSLGLYGLHSLNNDKTLPPYPNPETVGTGGSYISNADNPTLLTVRGVLGYKLESGLELYAAADQSISGESAPVGLNLVFGIQGQLYKGSKNSYPAEHDVSGANPSGLVSYSLEARVSRVNDRLNLVKIDKGSNDGVQVGQVFDIFSRGRGSTGEAVACGRVTDVRDQEAVVTITEYFKEVLIENDFTAKRLIQ